MTVTEQNAVIVKSSFTKGDAMTDPDDPLDIDAADDPLAALIAAIDALPNFTDPPKVEMVRSRILPTGDVVKVWMMDGRWLVQLSTKIGEHTGMRLYALERLHLDGRPLNPYAEYVCGYLASNAYRLAVGGMKSY